MALADLVLAPDALAPSRAREALAEALADKASVEWLSRAQLALSEVVSNAVRHGGAGPLQLVIDGTTTLVTVRVVQVGPPPERPSIVNMPHPWSTSGYGLAIIDSIADRWGVQLEPPSVWFELEL